MRKLLIKITLVVTILFGGTVSVALANDNNIDDDTSNEKPEETLTYNVEFKMNGGEPKIEIQTVKDSELVQTVEKPTKPGYRFIGWYTHPKGDPVSKKWDFESDIVLGNMVLFAYYEEEEYTVVYDSEENKDPETIYKLKYGEYLKAPKKPNKEGYTFDGWYKDKGTLEDPWDFEKDQITKDIILYPKWIKLAEDDSSEIIEKPVQPKPEKPRPEDPTVENPSPEIPKPIKPTPDPNDPKEELEQPETGIESSNLFFMSVLGIGILTLYRLRRIKIK